MSQFSTFLRKHSTEMRLAGNMFGLIFDSLPIDNQDKANAREAIEQLRLAADNIERAAAKVKDVNAPTASQLKAAVEPAVKEIARSMIDLAVNAALERLMPTQEQLNDTIDAAVKERLDRDLADAVTNALAALRTDEPSTGQDTNGG